MLYLILFKYYYLINYYMTDRYKLSTDQLSLLQDVYYENKFFFCRDKLFQYLQQNHPNSGISRRMLWKWLASQATHMIHQRSKSIRDIKTQIYTTPRTVIQIDLADVQNIEKDNYKYIMAAVDLFSKKV